MLLKAPLYLISTPSSTIHHLHRYFFEGALVISVPNPRNHEAMHFPRLPTTLLSYKIHSVNSILQRQETSSPDPSLQQAPPLSNPPSSSNTIETDLVARQLSPATVLSPNSLVREPGSSNPECDPYLYGSYYVPPACQPYAPAPSSTSNNGLYTPWPFSTYNNGLSTPQATYPQDPYATGAGAGGVGTSGSPSSGTSAGVKAGIEIGVIAGVAALATGGYILYRWFKNRQGGLQPQQHAPAGGLFPPGEEHEMHEGD